MFCKFCSAQIDDNSIVCPNCGANLTAPNNGGNFQQPQPNYNPAPYQGPVPGKGLAIASLVMGLISFFIVPLLFGGLGIVFGGVAKSKGYRGGMATAGIVLGIIGIALWIIMIAFIQSAYNAALNSLF